MIFRQSLQRELSRTFTATLVVLITIVMTMMLIRTLGLASKGSVNPQEVFLIMAYSVMGHIPTILTLSLFITVVSTLARLTQDSEMVIWLSSGQSLLQFLRPLFVFAAPMLITTAVMALLVWPWSNSQMQSLRERFEGRGDLERVAPGQFQESSNGKRVFYIDKVSSSAGSNHVFIADFANAKEQITSAQSGHTEIIKGEKYLVLTAGQRLEQDTLRGETKLVEFQKLGVRMSAVPIDMQIEPPKARSSLNLMQHPTQENLGELAWRFSLALAAINFVVLGLAITKMNPRAGRNSHLMFALLAFIVYYNFINVAQAWIAAGKTNFWSAILILHGGTFLISMGWLMRRNVRP
ncbi:MAG: LPS export ABC transporter permease LptF [Cytophagales bacterium]|nr:LPS export ABC transporter permease LptF [Cytophagales bacterium]